MTRPTIDLPQVFPFSTEIPIRITDINYGNHVGNDTILTLLHEARMQFLLHHGYSEKDIAGAGMIMGDVSIIFKNEVFYGEQIRVSVAVSNISRVSFDVVYKIDKYAPAGMTTVALAKTGMICFDYSKKKVVSVPEEVKLKFAN